MAITITRPTGNQQIQVMGNMIADVEGTVGNDISVGQTLRAYCYRITSAGGGFVVIPGTPPADAAMTLVKNDRSFVFDSVGGAEGPTNNQPNANNQVAVWAMTSFSPPTYTTPVTQPFQGVS
ncbi:MAG: hypothetical protein NT069_34695 [Planctomycetota bacterium]|nr:hypothetical protein [Planctomycetota bacterium]